MLSGYPDPFGEHELLNTFLASVKKLQKGKAPKFPYPAPLLKACVARYQRWEPTHLTISAALTTAFSYCLRSMEYVATPKYRVPNLRWGHVVFQKDSRTVDGATYKRKLTGTKVSDSDAVLLDLDSTKNSLGSATRDMPRTDTTLCAVKALANLYTYICQTEDKEPDDARPVFLLPSSTSNAGPPLDRTDINTILRENLEYCGISEEAIKTFGSHSLRRGGACAHIAAGADPEAVKRLGRWVGDTWNDIYVSLSDGILKGTLFEALEGMPRFHRN
jgi:integrase